MYKTAHIDVTPRVTATGFQAQARMLRDMREGLENGDETFARDLGRFSTSGMAVEHARRWAVAYCDEHWF